MLATRAFPRSSLRPTTATLAPAAANASAPSARLSAQALYRIELVNRQDAPALSRGTPLLKQGPVTLSGRYLMSHGLTLPWSFPETMWVIEGTRL